MRRLLALALGVCAAASIQAQTRPNFSGTWVLNTAKSRNLGMMSTLGDTLTKVVRTETRSLSPDGKTMTVESVRAPNAPLVMVFDRQ